MECAMTADSQLCMYGLGQCLTFPSVSELMTIPRAERLLLIFLASSNV